MLGKMIFWFQLLVMMVTFQSRMKSDDATQSDRVFVAAFQSRVLPNQLHRYGLRYPPAGISARRTCTRQRFTFLSSLNSDESEYNDQNKETPFQKASGGSTMSKNEFSRILSTDRIFPRSSQQQRRQQQNRSNEYNLITGATIEECQALAQRFDITKLTKLQANIQIRPAICGMTTTTASTETFNSNSYPVLEINGIIESHLTQTCVRTGEQFTVDVDVPVEVLVKPMSIQTMFEYNAPIDIENSSSNNLNYDNNKKKKKKKKQKQGHSIQDVFDLQNAINDAESDNDMFGGSSSTTLIEDEAIYSSQTGLLDVGELIAQTFWLQLDPYPKKPGTGPIKLKISG